MALSRFGTLRRTQLSRCRRGDEAADRSPAVLGVAHERRQVVGEAARRGHERVEEQIAERQRDDDDHPVDDEDGVHTPQSRADKAPHERVQQHGDEQRHGEGEGSSPATATPGAPATRRRDPRQHADRRAHDEPLGRPLPRRRPRPSSAPNASDPPASPARPCTQSSRPGSKNRVFRLPPSRFDGRLADVEAWSGARGGKSGPAGALAAAVPAPLRHGILIFLVVIVVEYLVVPELIGASRNIHYLERLNVGWLIAGVVLRGGVAFHLRPPHLDRAPPRIARTSRASSGSTCRRRRSPTPCRWHGRLGRPRLPPADLERRLGHRRRFHDGDPGHRLGGRAERDVVARARDLDPARRVPHDLHRRRAARHDRPLVLRHPRPPAHPGRGPGGALRASDRPGAAPGAAGPARGDLPPHRRLAAHSARIANGSAPPSSGRRRTGCSTPRPSGPSSRPSGVTSTRSSSSPPTASPTCSPPSRSPRAASASSRRPCRFSSRASA